MTEEKEKPNQFWVDLNWNISLTTEQIEQIRQLELAAQKQCYESSPTEKK